MSVYRVEYDVDWAQIVLKRKTGGTSTLNVAMDFWPAGQLYSGSPAIFPLLVSPPRLQRGVGNTTAIRYGVSIQLYSKTAFRAAGIGFADFLEDHEAHGATVTCFYAPKALDALAATNNTAQTLEVVDIDYADDQGICTLRCVDTWFKDKQYGLKFLSADFGANVETDRLKWLGEMKPIVFGHGATSSDGLVMSSAPIVDSTIQNDAGGDYQQLKIFAGVTPANTLGMDVRNLYARNPWPAISPIQWYPLDIQFAPRLFSTPVAGPTSLVTDTWFSMRQWRFARLYTPPVGKMFMCPGVTVRLRRVGTIPDGWGQLQIRVVEAYSVDGGDNWAVYGPTLATATIDPQTVPTSATDLSALFRDSAGNEVPALLPGDGHKYFFILEGTNTTDATNYIEMTWDAAVTTDPTYTNDQLVSKEGWKRTLAQLQMQVWTFGTSGSGFAVAADGVGPLYNWYVEIFSNAKGIHTAPFSGVEFKVEARGVSDDGSGTWTGSASSRIDCPADIVNFILQDTQLGAGVPSGSIDATSFSNARTSAYDLGFSYESDLSCSQLIEQVCRQGRLILYKKRDGKLAAYFPAWSGSPSTVISEGRYQGDMTLEDYEESGFEDVVNFLEAVYNYDSLQRNTDPSLLRISRDPKFLGLEYTYPTDMGFSTTDPTRIARSSDSINKFGKRPLLLRLDTHVRASTARNILNYLGDRYAYPNHRATVRVRRAQWYSTIDLFYNLRIEHTGIPAALGTSYEEKVHSDGTPITVFVDGRPTVSFLGGGLLGRVVNIVEEGPWMSLTIESENPY